MEVKSEVVPSASKAPAQMVSIIRDITDRKRMEQELQSTEMTLRHLATELMSQNEELHESATHDQLTGIRNRAYLEASIMDGMQHADRGVADMSLILFDLDHFKDVNDTHGHDVGDQVLIHIVQTVKCIIRKSDVFARWGGEEFVVFLPDTKVGDACMVAEKIRKRVENTPHCVAGKITVSIGVATQKQGEYIQDWFKRADVEMYKAKSRGRNRVSCGR